MAWSLDHSKMFTLGCTDLVVSVDHKPLVGILNDRHLGNIDNPRLQNIKEHTLKWNFSIVHNPGKFHVRPDAVSRHPTAQYVDQTEEDQQTCPNIFTIICDNTSVEDTADYSNNSVLFMDALDIDNDPKHCNPVEEYAQCVGVCSLYAISDKISVTLNDIFTAGQEDPTYQTLMSTIEKGFPSTRSLTDASIRQFWEVRHRLYTQNNIIYMDKRLVIPLKLQKEVLQNLHSANQGVTGMRKRANTSVYWPGMSAAISNFRNNCLRCDENAPSQPAEPMITSPSPEWPYQQIAVDYFEIESHA